MVVMLLYFIAATLVFNVGVMVYSKYAYNKLNHLNNIRDLEFKIATLAKDLLDAAENKKSISSEEYMEVVFNAAYLVDVASLVRRYYRFVGRCPCYYVRDSQATIKKKFQRFLPVLNGAKEILDKIKK